MQRTSSSAKVDPNTEPAHADIGLGVDDVNTRDVVAATTVEIDHGADLVHDNVDLDADVVDRHVVYVTGTNAIDPSVDPGCVSIDITVDADADLVGEVSPSANGAVERYVMVDDGAPPPVLASG